MGQGPPDRSDPGSRRTNGGSYLARYGTLQRPAVSERVTRVLNRATWSSRALSRILLLVLVSLFVADNAPVVIGIDAHD